MLHDVPNDELGSAVSMAHDESAMVFGIASNNSVRSTLSPALTACGMSLRSPRMYAGSRLARRSGALCSRCS